ncbi:MAG: metallophosphoesterase [Clostridia bacterium]
MALYAISDLHLSFGTNKPMDIFGGLWKNYEEKIKKNWIEQVSSQDFVVIPGDISWGMDLKEAYPDFKYINDLPGQKLLLRGNHDYYFSTKTKLENYFKEKGFTTLKYLHNNAIDVGKYIICGTRGWGKTEIGDVLSDKKIIVREQIRLKISLEAAKKMQDEYLEQGIKKDIIVALHFPPFIGEFEKIMKEYDVKKCMYGHLHGFGHSMVKEGNIASIEYIMVGCDYTGFKLIEIK